MCIRDRYCIEDTGKYINLKRIPTEKKAVGTCPRCGKNVFEGKKNYYCENNDCGFSIWKEDRYNGITLSPENASVLLAGKSISKIKKKLNGESERKSYILEDTGKYVNIRAEDK